MQQVPHNSRYGHEPDRTSGRAWACYQLRFSGAHGVWLSADEAVAAGCTGGRDRAQPLSNLRSVPVQAPVRCAETIRGWVMGVGHGMASIPRNGQNMFRAMRLAATPVAAQADTSEHGSRHLEAFRMATEGSARSWGWTALAASHRAGPPIWCFLDVIIATMCRCAMRPVADRFAENGPRCARS